MIDRADQSRMLGVFALLAALGIVSLAFQLDSHRSFHLWDEGFLWYGAQRVMQGEVPIRDFMAYDPGRYYWSAALMTLKGGDRLINLRIAIAVFQTLGLFIGLRSIVISSNARLREVVPLLGLTGATLVLWMAPDYRVFDISVSCILIGTLTALARSPKPNRYFLTGFMVGLAAVFGRNHGVYGLAGSIGVMLWLHMAAKRGPGLLKGGLIFAAGVSLGFLPVLLMMALIPGFAVAFIDSVLDLLRQGATNLPVPVPWPWTVNYAEWAIFDSIRGALVGLFFIATLIFGPITLIWIWFAKKRYQISPLLVACASLALPYAHYAFSRSDVEHLGAGIFPLLFGLIAISASMSTLLRWATLCLLCVASGWVMIQDHPAYACRPAAGCVNVEITGSILAIDPGSAGEIDLLRKLAAIYAPGDQTFIAMPFWPGAYAVLGRKAPMWEIYALFPASPEAQRLEIERLKAARPGFAIILDMALDGREALRFRNTHPLINQYIDDTGKALNLTPDPQLQIFDLTGLSHQ